MGEQATVAPAGAEVDGRHDFDFIFGRWRMAHRKVHDPFAEQSEWLEFESTSEAYPILGGLGNVDMVDVPDFPGRGPFHGFTLRLFDPGARVWRIWWASTVSEGQLDTPVVGAFRDGAGRFECDDLIRGRELSVRYDWTDITPTSSRWEQSFSFDGGKTFEPNWTIELTRIS
jgi:hypothetical protein